MGANAPYDELKDALLPMRDEKGNVTGFMDRVTTDYLASKASDPTQASIDELLSCITRVRVVPFTNYTQGSTEQKTLLNTSDPMSIEFFRSCFTIDEDATTFGHCMCVGDPHIELYSSERLVATQGYHHGSAVRWNAWKHDACLKEPDRLLDWMSAHGVDGPRQEVEETKRGSEAARLDCERWKAAMPEYFQPFWEHMKIVLVRDPELHGWLLDAFRAAVPDMEQQALILFGWFGTGAGPWSEFPSYEVVPEELLLHYPTQLLIDALVTSAPTDAQWLGAVRYFAGWDFNRTKKGDRRLLPTQLRQRLFEAARTTELTDNVERARIAFGG